MFRRAICAIPTNSMNKTFATFTKALKKDRYLESIQAHFLTLPSYRRFPTDEEFRRDLQTRDLYNFRSRSYWLRRLENHGRKERVPVDEYTIEHILPQNENLSPQWREALGPDWQRIQQTWLHTLGNLTLTGYNSEYSDRPFTEKRDMPDAPEKGLKQSPLKLNQGLGQLETWNEEAIKARAGKLADLALSVWAAQMLSRDILDAYSPKAADATDYTIDDHPHLLRPNMRPVFEAFRKEVLALDPCVTEEFLKLYVAYKAETNFVDVVPQAKRLRLSLNMRFAEINDPKGLCKDVTGIGRWGNGDVEISLSNGGLPYVIGLVRQSLELQLGNSWRSMNEAETRAEHIDPALEGGGLGRGRRQPHPARVPDHAWPPRRPRAARQGAHRRLRPRSIATHKLAVVEAKAWDEAADRRRGAGQGLRRQARRPLHLRHQRPGHLRHRHEDRRRKAKCRATRRPTNSGT